MSDAPSIAIIGAGFSGSLLAVQLARQAKTPLHITLYDTHGAFANGVAYGTREPLHLLNVAAARMGAMDKEPEHFYAWLKTQANIQGNPDEFMPRMIYARYLTSLLQEAKQKATIECVTAEVTDITPQGKGFAILTLKDGSTRTSDRVALALGNLPAQPFSWSKALTSPRYIPHVWAAPHGSILGGGDKSGPVGIIGTGLTTIDAILTLRKAGYTGKIIALSRNGLLPQPHLPPLPAHPRFLTPESAPSTALGMLRRLSEPRSSVPRRRAPTGARWWTHSRPDTQALWQHLSQQQQRKLRRTLSFWGVTVIASCRGLKRHAGKGKLKAAASASSPAASWM